MRHPDAMAHGPGSSGDRGRPLSALGRHQAQCVGEWLRQNELLPQKVFHSPAFRCVEAAQWVTRAAGVDSSCLKNEEGLYMCTPGDIENLLTECSVQRVLVLGHNPTMAEAMIKAVGRDTFDDGMPVHVPPGYIALIQFTTLPPTFAPGVCEVLGQRMPERSLADS